ncbi:MAG: hypothetical protein ACR2OH_08095 [Microthrixaceae bacterium]
MKSLRGPFPGWAAVLAVAAVLLVASCAGSGASDVAAPDVIGEEVASSEATATTTPASGPVTGLLYVAEAGSAQVDGDWPTVQVTLSEVDAEVLWFQDRPGRDAGEIRMAELVDEWADVGFADVPPNAVIRHDAGDGLGTVVEMSDPTWDQPGGRLSFTATVADYESGAEPLPWLMSDVSLFIDDGGTSLHPAKLTVSGAAPGQNIGIELTGNGSKAPAWSLGPTSSNEAGLELDSESGSIPVDSFSVNDTEVRLGTSAGGGTGSALSMSLALFVEVPSGATSFHVRSTSGPGVEVQLALGNAQPQTVNESETLFEVNPT